MLSFCLVSFALRVESLFTPLQESQLQADAGTPAQPSSDAALPDIQATPEVLEPAASLSDGSAEQPVTEQVLAESLIPADAPVATNNEAAADASASGSGAAEVGTAETTAGTSGSDLPPPTGIETAHVQLAEAEDAAAAGVSGTADGNEPDPNGTAALIQVNCTLCCYSAKKLKAGYCAVMRPAKAVT